MQGRDDFSAMRDGGAFYTPFTNLLRNPHANFTQASLRLRTMKPSTFLLALVVGAITTATFPSHAEPRTLPPGVTRAPVTFAGGHETVPVDRGRPVVLIAAALGVKDEVFRDAFSRVHPAGPGSGGPTREEAQANKKVLMDALGKFGITNERLDTVSNFYRCPPGRGNIWKTQPATANALVKNGAVIGCEITSGGYGYTTPPTVSVPGFAIAAARVELAFGKDFETNGSVSAITVSQGKGK